MSSAESFLEHCPSDNLPCSHDMEPVPTCDGRASETMRSIKDFLAIIDSLDQREEVFDSADPVISIQWFSRLREYRRRSLHKLG